MIDDRLHQTDKNAPYKVGVVREVDPSGKRARVEFADEDGTVSFWLNTNSRLARGNREYGNHRRGSLVNCLVDWEGEDGCILGGAYNDEDAPPFNSDTMFGTKFEDGVRHTHDTGSGTTTIDAPTTDLGPEGRTEAAGVGHLVHVTYGSSAGLHPIITGSPAVNIKA